jgi:hypothetical protein
MPPGIDRGRFPRARSCSGLVLRGPRNGLTECPDCAELWLAAPRGSAGSETAVGDLLGRISRAVSAAIGDGPFDSKIAAAAARKEVDAIREETGVDFVIESIDGRYNLILSLA